MTSTSRYPHIPNVIKLRIFKLISIILLIPIIFLINTFSAQGYETSLYRSTPLIYWFALFLLYITATAVIYTSDEGSKNLLFGTALLIIAHLLIILVPLFKGYTIFGNSDTLTHLTYIRSITHTGTIPSLNIYPGLHIFVGSITLITTIPIERSSVFIPQTFSIAFILLPILFIYRCFGRRIIKYILPITAIPYLMITHIILGAQSIIVGFYCIYSFWLYIHSRDPRFAIITILISTALLFYHPLTAGFVLIANTIFYFAPGFIKTLKSVLELYETTHPSFYKNKLGASLILIISILLFYRIFLTEKSLSFIIASFSGIGGDTSNYGQYQSILLRVSPDLSSIAKLVGLKYGPTIFIGCFTIVCILLRIYNRYIIKDIKYISLMANFLLFSILSLAALFMFFFGPPRVFLWVSIFGIMLIVFTIGRKSTGESLLDRITTRQLVTIFVVILLITSMIRVYPSPEFRKDQNKQVTQMQLSSTEWLLNSYNSDYNIHQTGFLLSSRYEEYINGENQISRLNSTPPEGLNYNNQSSAYIVLSKKGRLFYPTTYPEYEEFWKYDSNDFERMNTDYNTSKSYSNGEVQIYLHLK